MADSGSQVRERSFDVICRAIAMAAVLVLLVLVVGIFGTRAADIEVLPWVWGVALVTALVVAVLFVVTGRYEVVVDESGVRRTGLGGSAVDWSSISDVAELPTRQRHLALVGGQPQSRVWGECGLAKPHGLPPGTIVVQAGTRARAAISERTGREPRVLSRP